MPRGPRQPVVTLALLGALAAAAVLLRLALGRASHGLALDWANLDIRGVRVASGAIVGVTLAVAGVFLQAMLRNPLASPDIVGLASGSGLGVMVASWVGYHAGQGLASLDAAGLGPGGAALVGALLALAGVYTLGRRRGSLDPVRLILVGISISIMCSAATLLVRQFLPDQGFTAGRYLIGALRDETTSAPLLWTGALALLGLAVGCWQGPAMDAASLSEDEARSVGVHLTRLRAILFIGAGLLTAASVVLAGPVGFVGLICPHLARMLGLVSHRPLVVGAALAGTALVVGCDVLVRALDVGTGELPIGVLTSLIGAPVLVLMIRRDQSLSRPDAA